MKPPYDRPGRMERDKKDNARSDRKPGTGGINSKSAIASDSQRLAKRSRSALTVLIVTAILAGGTAIALQIMRTSVASPSGDDIADSAGQRQHGTESN